ncbi:MAG: RNA polymerase sigma factor [Terriglobia bacterium]
MDGGCLELNNLAQGAAAAAPEDVVLIRRAQAGDRAAFESLVRLYDREVLRLVSRMAATPEESSDLYQETFLKVYRSLGRFRFQSAFSTWLYRVAVNICLDHLRRKGRRMEVQAPLRQPGQEEFFQTVPEERPDLDPERALKSREISQRVRRALELLTPRERVVFEMRHYDGLKLRLIGEMCGTTEETAKNCLFRATQKLRGALGDLV